MQLFVGCPVWSFKGWVGNFYPEGTKPTAFLHEYARRLTAIEGNTTFYAVPSPKTVEQWVLETPDAFRFCLKVPRAISHEGRLDGEVEPARQFVDAMTRLGARLGPMLLQLPPRYSPKLFDDLGQFLEAWPAEARLSVEVRHLDWFDAPHHEALNDLLSEHHMARVVIDTRPIRSLEGDKILKGSIYQTLLEARARKPDVPVLPDTTADFLFIRYIGHPQPEANQKFLDEWGSYLVSQMQAGVDAYVFCHSPENITAPWLCRELHRRVAQFVPIAPLPWDHADAGSPEQGRLF